MSIVGYTFIGLGKMAVLFIVYITMRLSLKVLCIIYLGIMGLVFDDISLIVLLGS